MAREPELVEIRRGIGSAGVPDMLKSVLEAEGIERLIRIDSRTFAAPLGLPDPTFSVLVARDDMPRALEVLEAADLERDEQEGYTSLRQRAAYNRSHPAASAPVLVIGGLGILLLLLGLADLWQGWAAAWLLLGLSAFAFFVAFRSRD